MTNANIVGVWNGARKEMEEEGWLLVRTLCGGSKAMRDARAKFTPQTEAEKKEPLRYESRLQRSVLYPAYKKTIDKLASLPFQKEPTINGELPEPLDRIVSNADRAGTSLAMFAKRIYQDAIDRGVGFFLVDNVPTLRVAEDGTTSVMSLPEADEVDARPFFVRIAPDNLVGFTTEIRDGREVVTELRYREWFYRQDRMGLDSLVDRVRVWTETTRETWERVDSGVQANRDEKAGRSSFTGYTLTETIEHGSPVGIPLVDVYTQRVAKLQGKPPLVDLAELNVAHWNSKSTQGDALRYCRSPILVGSGLTSMEARERPVLGAGATHVSTSVDAEWKFVEIAGTSLAAGDKEIDTLRMEMEALGMQPMVATAGPSTATGEIRADVSEKSEAQSWVEAMEWALVQGFTKAAAWLGVRLDPDFTVVLFKDSSLIAGKATDLPFLERMRASGNISKPTYLREVKARGVLVTVDDVDAEIEATNDEAAASVQRQMEALAHQMKSSRDDGSKDDDDGADSGDARDDIVEEVA